MKVSVTRNTPGRKLVAVIGYKGEGIFLRDVDSGYAYLSIAGEVRTSIGRRTLEEFAKDSGRTPVYEGDTVTLQF